MNVFITGATGLIGQNLVNALINSNLNIELYALTRNPKKAQKKFTSLNIHHPIHWVKEITQKSITSSDVVVNLAGEPIAEKRWSTKQKLTICDSRWDITKTLADCIKASSNPPHTFISGSAIGIYGRQNKHIINESFTDYYPEFSHNICKKWESLALSVNDRSNIPRTRVAILRTGIVLDKNQGALAKMILPFKLGLGGKIASGKQYMSWIHINDMVNAIIHIITTESIQGPINMTAPHAVCNDEFSHVLSHTLSRPCVFSTPEFIVRMLFGEMADLLVFGQNVTPQKLEESGFTFTYPTLALALNEILKKY